VSTPSHCPDTRLCDNPGVADEALRHTLPLLHLLPAAGGVPTLPSTSIGVYGLPHFSILITFCFFIIIFLDAQIIRHLAVCDIEIILFVPPLPVCFVYTFMCTDTFFFLYFVLPFYNWGFCYQESGLPAGGRVLWDTQSKYMGLFFLFILRILRTLKCLSNKDSYVSSGQVTVPGFIDMFLVSP